MLNYIEDIELKPIIIGSAIPNASPAPRQNYIEPTYQKSTIALVLSLLGFIMLVYPVLGIFGLGFELIGLTLAVNSRRTEPSNWRRKIAITLSMIYLILFIISIIFLLLMSPEELEQIIIEFEAQNL